MKVYLATPVNGRNEKTLREKMYAACHRIEEMKDIVKELKREYHDVTFTSSFDIKSVKNYLLGIVNERNLSESRIMGECVRMVMEADLVVMDDYGVESHGCCVEQFVAEQYGKEIINLY